MVNGDAGRRDRDLGTESPSCGRFRTKISSQVGRPDQPSPPDSGVPANQRDHRRLSGTTRSGLQSPGPSGRTCPRHPHSTAPPPRPAPHEILEGNGPHEGPKLPRSPAPGRNHARRASTAGSTPPTRSLAVDHEVGGDKPDARCRQLHDQRQQGGGRPGPELRGGLEAGRRQAGVSGAVSGGGAGVGFRGGGGHPGGGIGDGVGALYLVNDRSSIPRRPRQGGWRGPGMNPGRRSLDMPPAPRTSPPAASAASAGQRA